jgi:hypothetical protein
MLQKEVPDDYSGEQKQAALWDRTLKCCAGQYILVLYRKTQQDATE